MEGTLNDSTQQLLFVGSYAPADQPGIHAFTMDSATGALTPRGSFTGIDSPSFLTADPLRGLLYAVSETSQADGSYGQVWALRFDAESLAIEPINQRSTGGDWPCHLAIDAGGRWLVASNYGSGNVALYPILPDGSLGEMSRFHQHHGEGPNTTRQEGPHAHSATFTPDNRFIIVADLGIDQLVTYKFDAVTGDMTPHGQTSTSPGSGPRHIAFHPGGRYLYLANELDSTVSTFYYEPETGSLSLMQILGTIPSEAMESWVADIHVTSSGKYLYVSNRGHDSIAIFGLEQEGRLTPLGHASCGGKWPRNFALAPGGRFMLVANKVSDEVSVLPFMNDGAELGSAVGHAAVSQPSCVHFVSK